jgi:hypothetical protein
MYTKEDVARLIADIKNVKSENPDQEKRMVGADRPQAGPQDLPERYIGNRDRDFAASVPAHGVDLSKLELSEPYRFGLSLEAYDPESGHVITICRPHRMDIADPEIFLTPTQLANAVLSVRSRRLHDERAGLVPPTKERAEANAKAAAARAEEEKKRLAEAETHKQQQPAA